MKNINLNEKDIFKLFNEIKIDENEFNKIDKDITDIQKKRIKKTLRKKIKSQNRFKILKYGSAAAAIILILLIGIGTASPAFAENIPVLGSIIQRLNDKMGINTNYTKYSKIINKKVTDKGISVTINEVIADDSKLLIGYTIKSNKKLKKEDFKFFSLIKFFKINGSKGNSAGSSSNIKYIDDYTCIISEEINSPLLKNSDRLNINLNIEKIGKIKGIWNFAFTASKKEICKESIVFNPNTKINLEDSIVNINKVVFSPIDTYISFNEKFKKALGKDDTDFWYWLAYDDKNVDLMLTGSHSSNTNMKNPGKIFECETNYKKLKYIPKYLTIIPVKTISNKAPKEINKPITGTFPIELSQGKIGKIIVEKINADKNKTTVNFKTIGKAPFIQAGRLYIKDSNGKIVQYKEDIKFLKRDEKNPNKFTVSFEPLNPNKKYNIYTNDFSNVEFREDLKFKIKLNK